MGVRGVSEGCERGAIEGCQRGVRGVKWWEVSLTETSRRRLWRSLRSPLPLDGVQTVDARRGPQQGAVEAAPLF